MEIGAIIDIRRNLPESVHLKPGDVLSVRVLEVFENRRARVDLGRFRALADIGFPVAAGDELRVRVLETGGQLRLQVTAAPRDLAPDAPAGGPVRMAALESLQSVRARIDQVAGASQRRTDAPPLPIELRQAAAALRLFLEPIDPRSNPEALAHRLRDFSEDSGLFLERRLAAAVQRTAGGAGEAAAPGGGSTENLERILSTDLKSRLLFIKGFLDGAVGRPLVHGSRDIAGLAGAAADLLADIRAAQEQMAKPDAPPAPFQTVHFDLPVAGERGRASLKVAYGRRPAAGREAGHRAAILLELDRMGAVRADLNLQSARLRVAVFVGNNGLRDRIQRHAAELREALAPFFEHVAFQVSVSARRIARFASEDWRPAGETQVDVHA